MQDMIELIDKMDVIADIRQIGTLIEIVLNSEDVAIVSFLNQHGFNLAVRDKSMKECLLNSNILLRDGVGMELALRTLGRSAGRNCNGTDFIPRLLKAAGPRSIAIFGTREPWLSRASAEIETFGVDVIVKMDGFQQDADYIAAVLEHKPEIVLLGLGMPKQEILSMTLKKHVDNRCLLINSGAFLDFLGGRFPRAPSTLRSLRLEWLFRLSCEPRRLARRYLTGGLLFLVRLSALLIESKRNMLIQK